MRLACDRLACNRLAAILLFAGLAGWQPTLADAAEAPRDPIALRLARADGREAGQLAVAETLTRIVPFETAPFPYRGTIPGTGKPFLDVERDGRLGHTAPRGGVYFEDRTYADRRVLLSIPRGFDPARPALIVLYLHGNEARLDRDVRDRQGVARQVAASGLNAVLVAPQLAVDALDSSAGRFWEPGHLKLFLEEAAVQLARLHGDPVSAQRFATAPVVIAAYSGGYLPAAFGLEVGGVADRVAGVILLDALFGEEERFARFIARRRNAFFISAASPSTASAQRRLAALVAGAGPIQSGPPLRRIAPGEVRFIEAPGTEHRDFVSRAWTSEPLRAVLARLPGYPRADLVGATEGEVDPIITGAARAPDFKRP